MVAGCLTLAYGQHFHVGVRGGLGMSGFAVKFASTDKGGDRIFSYNGGIYANLGLPLAVGNLEVEPGVQLSKLGGKFDVSEGPLWDVNVQYDPFYLAFPLMMQYSFDIGPAELYFGVGPQFNIGLFGEWTWENTKVGSPKVTKIAWDEKGELKRFFMDLKFKAGAEFFDCLRVGFYYDWGVTNMVDGYKGWGNVNEAGYKADDYTLSNGAFGLEISYSLF